MRVARGLWQPITRREVDAATTSRVEAGRTQGDDIRAALAYIRKHHGQPSTRYVEYPADPPAH